jgi:hypothetical protein
MTRISEHTASPQPEAKPRAAAKVKKAPTPGGPAQGVAPTDTVTRRLTELERLTAALSEVMKVESIGAWLKAPNPAFGGLKPLEVIDRGEGDRLWEMVYFLASGVAS